MAGAGREEHEPAVFGARGDGGVERGGGVEAADLDLGGRHRASHNPIRARVEPSLSGDYLPSSNTTETPVFSVSSPSATGEGEEAMSAIAARAYITGMGGE